MLNSNSAISWLTIPAPSLLQERERAIGRRSPDILVPPESMWSRYCERGLKLIEHAKASIELRNAVRLKKCARYDTVHGTLLQGRRNVTLCASCLFRGPSGVALKPPIEFVCKKTRQRTASFSSKNFVIRRGMQRGTLLGITMPATASISPCDAGAIHRGHVRRSANRSRQQCLAAEDHGLFSAKYTKSLDIQVVPERYQSRT